MKSLSSLIPLLDTPSRVNESSSADAEDIAALFSDMRLETDCLVHFTQPSQMPEWEQQDRDLSMPGCELFARPLNCTVEDFRKYLYAQ